MLKTFCRLFAPAIAAVALALLAAGCTVSAEKDPAFIKLSKKLATLEEEHNKSKRTVDNLCFEFDTLTQSVNTVKASVGKPQPPSPELAQQLDAALKRIDELEKKLSASAVAAAGPKAEPAAKPSEKKAEEKPASAEPATTRGKKIVARSTSKPPASKAGRAVAEQPPRTAPKGFYYKVRQGDTIHGLARSHRTSSAEILRANRLPMSATLYPGQMIYIPKTVASAD